MPISYLVCTKTISKVGPILFDEIYIGFFWVAPSHLPYWPALQQGLSCHQFIFSLSLKILVDSSLFQLSSAWYKALYCVSCIKVQCWFIMHTIISIKNFEHFFFLNWPSTAPHQSNFFVFVLEKKKLFDWSTLNCLSIDQIISVKISLSFFFFFRKIWISISKEKSLNKDANLIYIHNRWTKHKI